MTTHDMTTHDTTIHGTTPASTADREPGTGLVPGAVWWARLQVQYCGLRVTPDEHLARDPYCPPALLDQLADGTTWPTRIRVAVNRSTRPSTLARLAHDPDSGIRSHVAGHPALDDVTYQQLAKDADTGVVHALICSPHTPTSILLELNERTHSHPDLLANPHCPVKLLEAASTDPEYIANVAGNPNTPRDILKQYIMGEYIAGWEGCAKNPRIEPGVLYRIYERAPVYREAILQNPACPHKLIQQTIRARRRSGPDSTLGIQALANNPSLTEHHIHALWRYAPEARVELAQHPNCPYDLLEAAATAPGDALRLSVALNRTLPTELVGQLAHDRNGTIAMTIWGHENADQDMLYSIPLPLLLTTDAPRTDRLEALEVGVCEILVGIGGSDSTLRDLIEAARLLNAR